MSYQPEQLTGNEIISCTENEVDGATVFDFWQWAFSNLCTNDVRCTYAEWLVHRLLGIQRPRVSWAACDLVTAEGVRVEVKTSVYIQSWHREGLSAIKFGGLKSKATDADTNRQSDLDTYNADIYVFCVQIETDPSKWNALDIDQWRFYVISRELVASTGYKSMSLPTVAKLCNPMTATEFSRHTKSLIGAFRPAASKGGSLAETLHEGHPE